MRLRLLEESASFENHRADKAGGRAAEICCVLQYTVYATGCGHERLMEGRHSSSASPSQVTGTGSGWFQLGSEIDVFFDFHCLRIMMPTTMVMKGRYSLKHTHGNSDLLRSHLFTAKTMDLLSEPPKLFVSPGRFDHDLTATSVRSHWEPWFIEGK